MPSPLTPIVNRALANPPAQTKPALQPSANTFKPATNTGPAQINNAPGTPTQAPGSLTGTGNYDPANPLSGQQVNGGTGTGLSPADIATQALGSIQAPGYAGQPNPTPAADTAAQMTPQVQSFLNSYNQQTPQEQQAMMSAYNNEQAMAQVIGGPAAQQQLSDAAAAFTQGNIQTALTGQEGLANINLENTEGQQQDLEATEANQISQQQLGIQEQYNPQLYAITQAQQALQGQGLGLQAEGVRQEMGQNKNTLQQALMSSYGSAAASGAINTTGAKNAYNQDQYNYDQQRMDLQRQLQQVGLSQQGLGLSEKQSAITEAETKAGYGVSQEQIDDTAQRIGFNAQDLQQRITNAMQTLGISQNISSEDILQAMADAQAGIPNSLSSILPYIASTGNYPAVPGVTVPATGG
jgi:hypothetical protein